jgi:hypothetical protein
MSPQASGAAAALVILRGGAADSPDLLDRHAGLHLLDFDLAPPFQRQREFQIIETDGIEHEIGADVA